MKIGLKVDVDTLRGTREGVPALARLFERRGMNATFLFSVGPDHTGRALRRLLKPGFLAKVLRTSVPSTYGLKTLAYGTLLPGPHIGRCAAGEMRAVREGGFEVGLHSFDHVRWQDAVARKGAEWTRQEWRRGIEDYEKIFGVPPDCFGAAGWQINATVLELEEAKLKWASDVRGKMPFLPCTNGHAWQCVQLPTTLPTMDEIIGRDGVTVENVGARLSGEVERLTAPIQIFTLHAELEGGPLLAQFEQALDGWQAAGATFCSLGEIAATLDRKTLPVAAIDQGMVAGRAGKLAIQGASAPSDRAALDLSRGENIA
jgi:peptidoglycan/xylan/chitin deacetylase (PgdA/CDA1 family)